MKNLKRMLGVTAIVALASQINIELFGADFRVSAGIIFFVTFLFYYDELKPIPTGIISGIVVYIFRLVVYFLNDGNITDVVWSYQLEIIFYAFYAGIYSLLIKKNAKHNINIFFLIAVASELGGNIIEVYVTSIVTPSQFHVEIITTLLLVAIVRSSIIWIVLNGLRYYKMLLMKEEHEKRYKRLLWLTAQLKTEMYWMEKNMDNIEKVMSNSYKLFEKINSDEDKNSWEDRAVSIARDVHEIKKEYELAIRGVKEITESELQDQGMNFKDIINILDETMKREIARIGKNIELLFDIKENFYTSKHYYLMSIFRNLIMNGIDAISDTDKEAMISFTHEIVDSQHVFTISDTGCGIAKEDLNHIFSPGFSTKINYSTGEINRGLGLSVVHHILEKYLDGRIDVNSEKDNGTNFYIYIPRKSLEVNL